MKFSEALHKFYIMPLFQSEIVQSEVFTTDDGPSIVLVKWHDSDTNKTHIQLFLDQDIHVSHGPGQFSVTTLGHNERVGFIALAPYSLE